MPAAPLSEFFLTVALLATPSLARAQETGVRAQEVSDSPPVCAASHQEHGKASWYGRLRHGKKTADGQRMDRNALTAAHRRLPFGTTVKVTNLDNGKSVELTVNDRGPYVRGRVIDVSQRAAQELGFAEAGTAPVKVETVPAC